MMLVATAKFVMLWYCCGRFLHISQLLKPPSSTKPFTYCKGFIPSVWQANQCDKDEGANNLSPPSYPYPIKINNLSRSTKSLWHPLHRIPMTTNIHTRHTRNLPYPPPQLLITRRHNKTPPLRHLIHQTIICITSLAPTGNTFESRILRHLQCHLVFGTEFFQFSHDAVGDARDAFGEEAVHHRPNDVHFVSDGEVDEVGIDQDVVGGAQLGVVLEEEGGDGLVDVSGLFLLGQLFLLGLLFFLVGFDAGVFWGDYFFGYCELARLFCFTHG